MGQRLKLPIGIDNFEKIRQEQYYYVDKTEWIEQLLERMNEVSLFTRPRRFGKTLNMSMLQSFFEIGCKQELYENLYISGKDEICREYMGQFPVVSISLKDVDGQSYQDAVSAVKTVIGTEAMRFQFLMESNKLTEADKELYAGYTRTSDGAFAMSDQALPAAIKNLSMLLKKHYQRAVIILIDEYDVPLDKASQHGYYENMVTLLRGMLGSALKSNNSLKFAVLTGCLRIAKESIFTGLNNFKVYSMTDRGFDRYFGFTDEEVREMLCYYDLEKEYETVRDWYDGYRLGKENIYCPWDVINYCADHLTNEGLSPQNYWLNTSGNDIIRRFINRANVQTRSELEELLEGKSIMKEIHQELTYNELDASIDNLWSVLFTTGYLTVEKQLGAGQYELQIPNLEIRDVFAKQIREWFMNAARKETGTLNTFCTAFLQGNVSSVEKLLGEYLRKTISIRDTAVKEKKENFYHGILLGLLRFREDWYIKSNAESGDGYSGILIEAPEESVGIIIEVKYAAAGNLQAACEEAIKQIKIRHYEEKLREDGMKTIHSYGIACYRKECVVIRDDE